MKIGIIAHDAHPIREPFLGHSEMLTHLLVKELVARNHSVRLLCLKGSDFEGICDYYEYGYDQFDSAEDHLLNNLKEVSTSLTKFLANDFDVVHNHSLHFLSIVLGNNCKYPFVTTLHTPPEKFLSIGLEAVSHTQNQTFTTVSKYLANEYKEFNIEPITIYSGINLDKWSHNSDENSNYFAWCGKIHKDNGLMEILKICNKHKVTVIFAGPIVDVPYYEEYIEPFLINSTYCHYIGNLKQLRLNSFLKNSKGLIYSSLKPEPYSLILAEALASGIPIIANDIGATSEIISEKCGFVYDIKEEQSLIDALTQSQTLDRSNCRLRAEQFCSHKSMADDYEKIYEYVASNDSMVI